MPTDAKPLTRSEFKEWASTHGDHDSTEFRGLASWAYDRLLATIEAGGFAPEPVTEGQLRAWLYRERPGCWRRPFEVFDLGRALALGRMHGVHPTLDAAANGAWVLMIGGRTYRFNDLLGVARHVTALAYKSENPTVNVSHLLGDQS